jgi:hypothetical protein
MGRKFLIRINFSLVTEHLSRADGIPYSAEEVRQWLIDAGLHPAHDDARPDEWVADEADLGHLDPSEVLHAEIWPAP